MKLYLLTYHQCLTSKYVKYLEFVDSDGRVRIKTSKWCHFLELKSLFI